MRHFVDALVKSPARVLTEQHGPAMDLVERAAGRLCQ
jgi:hypothetical protein